MTCPQLVDSGVYVLGALSPSQRVGFEQHMATCAECQAEVNDLAVLPGLLGRLDEPTVVAASELPQPSTVLTGTIRQIRRQRRGRRVVALSAGFAVACLALVIGLVMPQFGDSAATVTPVALHAMQSVSNEHTLVSAQVGFTPVSGGGGGTQIEVKCQYGAVPPGSAYAGAHKFELFVYPRNGSPAEQVSAWTAGPGTSIQRIGDTAWSLDKMARIELRSANGEPLLVYNLT